MLVQRLQKDILPKIESQIAELAKQDEPTEATKAISKQLKVGSALLLARHLHLPSLESVSVGHLLEFSPDFLLHSDCCCIQKLQEGQDWINDLSAVFVCNYIQCIESVKGMLACGVSRQQLPCMLCTPLVRF